MPLGCTQKYGLDGKCYVYFTTLKKKSHTRIQKTI